jgi:multiple sugar transport system permease protein
MSSRAVTSRYARGLHRLLTPYLLGVVALVLLPALVTVVFAFTAFDGFSPSRFVGFQTFAHVLADPEFQQAIRTTLAFVAIAIPFRVLGGLLLALLANGRGRLASVMRVAVFTPAVIPDAATALVWLWIVNPSFGPVGLIVRTLGGEPGPVLLDPWGARLTMAAIAVLALGEGFLVTIAARREISETLYEAARVEGARPLTRFRRITLPILAPTLALLAARDFLLSMQLVLVPTLLLTRGGPLGATRTLPVLVYERGFAEARLDEGSAMAVLLLLFGLAALALALVVWWARGRSRRKAAGGPRRGEPWSRPA